MSKNQNPTGMPMFNLENPEVVKLRIAKEHMDTLFNLKKERLHSTSSAFSMMILTIKHLEEKIDFNRDSLHSEVRNYFKLDAAYRGLFIYVAELEIFGDDLKQKYLRIRPNQDFKRGRNNNLIFEDKVVPGNILKMELQSDRMELLSQISAKIGEWERKQLNQMEEELRTFLS